MKRTKSENFKELKGPSWKKTKIYRTKMKHLVFYRNSNLHINDYIQPRIYHKPYHKIPTPRSLSPKFGPSFSPNLWWERDGDPWAWKRWERTMTVPMALLALSQWWTVAETNGGFGNVIDVSENLIDFSINLITQYPQWYPLGCGTRNELTKLNMSKYYILYVMYHIRARVDRTG